MRRFFFRVFVLLVLAIAGLLAYGLFLPVGPETQELVQLKPGSPARRIAADLASAGVIRSQTAFLLWHYAHGRSLKAGEYSFDHPAGLREVYDRIARGDIYFHTVVIPEGFSMFDIAAAMEQSGLGRRDDFLKIARTETALVRDLDPAAPTLEGYLFPDTYHFTRTQSLKDMAATMVRRFRQTAAELPLNQGMHDVVTMASLVEKETGVNDERPVVAGVFRNRLNRRIPLATDPAVIYAAMLNNRWRGTIYQSDLQFNSPYNTYRNAGLPPGPICNPGKQSLLAALHPASTEYLYFVSDNQGHHRFARTLAEHGANVAAYRRAVGQGH
ncbi:MAG TPA: endolytic transglycosylase MltG [Candidatus Angelobacter sp.]|nr:endolytic transglycosylase MltG [Candidatus Angelobacter sp.]